MSQSSPIPKTKKDQLAELKKGRFTFQIQAIAAIDPVSWMISLEDAFPLSFFGLALALFGKVAFLELILNYEWADVIALMAMISSSDATDLVIDLGRAAIWTEQYLSHAEKSESLFNILWSIQSLRMSSPPSIDCWMAL
jgi:hypothetical protein